MSVMPRTSSSKATGGRIKSDRRYRLQRTFGGGAFYFLVVAMVAVFTFVFFWTILSAFKLERDQLTYPPKLIFQPTISNFLNVFQKTKFFSQLRNSMIIASGAVLLSLALGLPAAYSIAKLRQRTLALSVLVVRMIPGMVFMVPLFVFFKVTGLTDTHLGLILAHQILTLPMTIWIMISFFAGVPWEIEEAALIDGASRWGSFWRIALPLCAPGVAVTAILCFIQSWNNFIFVLIVGGGRTMTLPMAVYNFMGFEMLSTGSLSAAATLITLPILVLSVIAQRWLVRGLTMGAVK